MPFEKKDQNVSIDTTHAEKTFFTDFLKWLYFTWKTSLLLFLVMFCVEYS